MYPQVHGDRTSCAGDPSRSRHSLAAYRCTGTHRDSRDRHVLGTPKQHTGLHGPPGPSVMRGMGVKRVWLRENNLSHLCRCDDARVEEQKIGCTPWYSPESHTDVKTHRWSGRNQLGPRSLHRNACPQGREASPLLGQEGGRVAGFTGGVGTF